LAVIDYALIIVLSTVIGTLVIIAVDRIFFDGHFLCDRIAVPIEQIANGEWSRDSQHASKPAAPSDRRNDIDEQLVRINLTHGRR